MKTRSINPGMLTMGSTSIKKHAVENKDKTVCNSVCLFFVAPVALYSANRLSGLIVIMAGASTIARLALALFTWFFLAIESLTISTSYVAHSWQTTICLSVCLSLAVRLSEES